MSPRRGTLSGGFGHTRINVAQRIIRFIRDDATVLIGGRNVSNVTIESTSTETTPLAGITDE